MKSLMNQPISFQSIIDLWQKSTILTPFSLPSPSLAPSQFRGGLGRGNSGIFARSIIFYLIPLMICGCNPLNQLSSQSVSNNLDKSNKCLEKPAGSLDRKNVEALPLDNQGVKKSGVATSNNYIGYAFNARSGQKLNYRTKQDICLWIYTPDNQLLNSGSLPTTGSYIIEISAPKGATTFEIEMNLETVQAQVSSSPVASQSSYTSYSSPTPSSLPNRSEPDNKINREINRPSPANTVQAYYTSISNHQYDIAWNKLSYSLQNNQSIHPDGYRSFVEWWTQMKFVEVQELRVLDTNAATASADVQLKYFMKTGKISSDHLQLFLVWDEVNNRWAIDKAKLIDG